MAKDTSIRALTLLGSALMGGCVTTPVVWTKPGVYDFPLSVERQQALFEFCMHSKGYRLKALPA